MIIKLENMSFKRSFSWRIFARVMRYAGQDIVRNVGLAIITITIFVLTLVLVNSLVAVNKGTEAALKAIEAQVDLTLFFTTTAPVDAVEKISAQVGDYPEVVKTDFMSAADVLAEFKKRHENNQEISASIDAIDANPFGAILIVHARETRDYQKLIAALDVIENRDIIQRRSFEDRNRLVERISTITERTRLLVFGLSVVFAVIAFLIVFNMVRVAIYTQREEIGVKRLVGAANWVIRAPFFIESIVYVAIAAGATFGILIFAARTIDPYLGPLFAENAFSLKLVFLNRWYILIGLEAIGLLALAWLSTWLAMRRYLRV